MARDKFRIRFQKVGDLRMVSHHDLMRCFERMLRRAALPFRSTEGFNPKPKMAFALSLALGIEGGEEVVELELESPAASLEKGTSGPEALATELTNTAEPEALATESATVRKDIAEPEASATARKNTVANASGSDGASRDEGTPDPEVMSEEELHARLAAQAPAGLHFLSVRRIGLRVKAQPRRACYQIELPRDRCAALPERMAALLAESAAWVERLRPEKRRVDVRPYLRDLRLNETTLEMDLWVTPTGTARPDDILGLLGLGDLPNSGAVLRRTLLELHDESVEVGGPSMPPGMEAPAAAGAVPHAAE